MALRFTLANGGYSAPDWRFALPKAIKDALEKKVTLDTSMDAQMSSAEIAAMRRSYGEIGLESIPADPFQLFTQWLSQAHSNPAIVEANAMVLSTADHLGEITSRTVLLKGVTDNKFIFFTNYNSRKGKAIHSQPKVSLLFPWFAMERQVSVTGVAQEIPEVESDEYFVSRPWSHQIGTWASRQSDPLVHREELEERWKAASGKWPEGAAVPRPSHWGGYAVDPSSIEFWQGRYSRLHDRVRYERPSAADATEWVNARFYP
jgi:pyridoxamine 5'-phosphate oxidase